MRKFLRIYVRASACLCAHVPACAYVRAPQCHSQSATATAPKPQECVKLFVEHLNYFSGGESALFMKQIHRPMDRLEEIREAAIEKIYELHAGVIDDHICPRVAIYAHIWSSSRGMDARSHRNRNSSQKSHDACKQLILRHCCDLF